MQAVFYRMDIVPLIALQGWAKRAAIGPLSPILALADVTAVPSMDRGGQRGQK